MVFHCFWPKNEKTKWFMALFRLFQKIDFFCLTLSRRMMHWGIMGHFRTLGPLGPPRHYEMQLLGACWKARYCDWKIFYQWDKYFQVAAHRPIKCTPKCQKVRKMAFLAGGRHPFGHLGPTVMVTTLLFFVCHKTHGRCTCRTTWNIFKNFYGILLPL